MFKAFNMNKIAATILLFGLCGAAQAQFQSDDEVVAAALNQKKFSQNLGRHHISLGLLGYFKSTSGDFELPGFDLSQGTGQFLNYRYSFDKNIDLAVDVRAWGSEKEVSGISGEIVAGGVGVGLRLNSSNIGERIFPYIQVNAYSTTEEWKLGPFSGRNEDPEIGFGVNGGFEIKLGKLISIPLEANYLYGKPLDDVSGYGFTTGVSFNWGDVN
ncbi:MAG: hypothetical protein A2509_01485 [Candidatus Edwardsbacteria bacterium RIFOXYD12_FULL_50_11]|uniref:Outer membrane protein beta-barrel domain-containing protein n=1 Tax=Candidatus Edwardsbacteria bacterium GWF2_54_11 TaxID=1817851 RepID=A0A1F5RCM2_9BACT|nr:MAG: hypothetical protein A2502_02810 [Candidatus Edwardsbacteria bacterium RifOxyC12_full_54_24]OGF07650.1 MAG: hypothetical protein A2273_04060 [Candidatus Edwardsbacteria bacterium RifOxyA12_full_54_48]OGF09901.1 MAG: hypothetical protein A3K15_10470 [Candidatus Edwardsbacteria bacterium GWE2_54_12]OGF12162.1 MAG: hypothetical protein A2024_04025 [Candidatus Edwardsbacteria bacterium GWF2_54_11]OGF16262.1 MAG: hypothetical protein A2509_01485 [Candidatus Edwardsbacteria bacterium RIFOXYD1